MKVVQSVLLLALAHISSASVIGIDFGSNYMKVALVQLKVPLEIVPNTISKRKTEIAVAFDRGERLYGSDATGQLSRKPGMAYTHFREMLGRNAEHPLVTSVEEMRYGTSPYYNETRGGMDYRYKGDKNIESFSAEELSAMVFSYARDITKDFGGQSVRDCVITVPSFATALERKALINAAEIAGLKVLSLIEENTAAALQLGKDNVEENKVVLYYNMGNTATQVMIARYSNYTVKEVGKNKTIGVFDVLSKSWDETLGGEQFDKLIMEQMADEFQSNTGNDVRSNNKAIAKLRAQATKTKHVLSANSEIPVKVNSLMDDKDYTTHMTRKQLETLSKPLLDRLIPPIERALKIANMTLADIDVVEMLGGSQRVPVVLDTLSSFFGESLPLGVHLNADEAPALGAAFGAANISTMFKVRKTGMVDRSPWPIAISLKSIPKVDETGVLGGLFSSKKTEEEIQADEESDKWEKSTTLFKPWSRLDSKKLIAFHHDRDIMCEVTYAINDITDSDIPLPKGTNVLIAQYNITGITEFMKGMEQKQYKTCGLEDNHKPKITLHFKLDSSGIVRVHKAEATCEQPEAPAPTLNDTATTESEEETSTETSKDTEESSTTEESSETDTDETATENNSENSETKENDEELTKEQKKAAKKAAKKEAKRKEQEKIKKDKLKNKKDLLYKSELNLIEDFSSNILKSLSPSSQLESINKLSYLQELDNERFYKLECKNSLESYLYSVKNQIDDDSEIINQISTEEQRETLLEKVRIDLEWMDDDGYDEKGDVYKARQLAVSELAEPIFFRANEFTERPKAVKMAEKRLKDIRLLVTKWIETMPQVTEDERNDVLKAVETAENWLNDNVKLQNETLSYERPAFTSEEVTKSLKPTANMVTRLSRKPKPKPILNVTNTTDMNGTDVNGTKVPIEEVVNDETSQETKEESNTEEGASAGDAEL